MTTPPRNSRLVLILLFLLFVGPLVVASVMYFAGDGKWRPSGSVAHGILLTPPPALPAGKIALPDGATAEFHGRWSLLYVGAGDCPEACKQALYRTRQVRRALGKEMARVQRFFVATGAVPDPAYVAAYQPGLVVLANGMADHDRVLAALGTHADGDVFLADPLGNLVLRFPAGTSMKDMHADLKLLLDASQIG